MLKNKLSKTLIASLLLAAPATHAASVVLDFNSFGNGQIIDNEYSVSHGVTISANNIGGGPDLVVIFDTTPSDTTSSNFGADPDLIGNFDNIYPNSHNQGLPDDYDPGNVLIIQENSSGCGADICTRPDDEGSRPAGSISFEFAQAIELLSLDFFDIETAEDNSQLINRIDVWDATTNAVTTVGYTPDTGGDNLWAQVLFSSAVNPALRNVGRIDVYMGGSGAIDNLTYSVVPVPSAVWLFGTALLGFIGFSRRTAI